VNRVSSDFRQESEAASGSVIVLLARAAVRVLTVPLAVVMAGCEPLIRILFGTLSVLGILATVVIGGSGAAPHFPFATALLVFAGCGIVPVLYRTVLKGISAVG